MISSVISMASLESSNLTSAVCLTPEQERAELASVLASETFRRSPQLSRLLSYLCDKYFRGEGGEIKEFSIAVDALGRDSQFDPQLDAVVRVDAHHLRKRLKQYYAAEGSDHDVQILIPLGQYVPHFVLSAERDPSKRTEPEKREPTDEVMTSVAESKEAKPKGLIARWRWLAAGLALAALAGWLFATIGRLRAIRVADAESVARNTTGGFTPAVLNGEASGIRILAGNRNGNYTDKAGRMWLSDRFYSGGATFHRGTRDIRRTQDPEMFQGGREGQFVYEIPLRPGIYELHLYFAETAFSSETLRSVSLAINGLPVSTLDVASDADGVNTATVKIFKDVSPAKDGLLHLTFQGTGPSFLNALEILPGIPGKMLPIRLAARDSPYRDTLGRVWMPDQYFVGGRRSNRAEAIEGTPDPDLYLMQRLGHFTYSIPVAEGTRYTITLHFAETWFNLRNSPNNIGSRVFDVYCNGTTLLKNFDILKETGGRGNRAVVKIFRNVAPSPQGKLDLDFVPINNYAIVSAIEVVEQN